MKDRNAKKNFSIKPMSLRKNFSWTLIGNIIYAGCQWGILIILAKLGSPEMVGKYSLGLAITAPIMLLTNLQLRGIQATDTKDLYKFGDYLGLRLITSLVAFFIVIIFVWFANYPLETTIVITIILLSKIIESISDVVYGLLQRNEYMDKISVSMILRGVLSLFGLGIVVWITKSIVFGTIALAITWFIVLVLYDLKNAVNFALLKPLFQFSTIKKIVKLSLPLGVVLMLGSLNTNLPRYFLEFFTDEETLGYFSAMAYLIVAGNTIINALGQSATPRLAKYFASGNIRGFKNLMFKLVGIALFVGVVGLIIALLFGKQVLTLIYQEDYAVYSDVFVIIMLSGAINYAGSFFGYGMTAARMFKIQPLIGICWLVTGLIASILLIPSYGLMGAAYTLVLSSAVQFVTKGLVIVYLLYVKRIENLDGDSTCRGNKDNVIV